MINALESSSLRPYLIRALYEWCTDHGFTPYVAVQVDESVQVPREYVKNGEIVLNISYDATSALKLGNEFIEFKARFAGTARDILVPVGRVVAIYARESGQGMAFPAPAPGETGAAAAKAAPSPLRDASRGNNDGEARVVHLVSDGEETASVDTPADAPDDEPPRPSGGGARPALKRVK